MARWAVISMSSNSIAGPLDRQRLPLGSLSGRFDRPTAASASRLACRGRGG